RLWSELHITACETFTIHMRAPAARTLPLPGPITISSSLPLLQYWNRQIRPPSSRHEPCMRSVGLSSESSHCTQSHYSSILRSDCKSFWCHHHSQAFFQSQCRSHLRRLLPTSVPPNSRIQKC